MLERLARTGFEIRYESHAKAILEEDFPSALVEIEQVLESVAIPITEIIGSGGGEAKGTQRMRSALNACGWKKTIFEIRKTINGVERESISHEVDHVRAFETGKSIALEIEWNNKDPFFDRDLENFKRLHAEGAISAGIIVTRGSSLQASLKDFVLQYARSKNLQSLTDLPGVGLSPTARQTMAISSGVERGMDFPSAWTKVFVADKFGEATTHWRKLIDRVSRGVGNPCPLLLIGLPDTVIRFDD